MKRRTSKIMALCIVSESELVVAHTDYDASWETSRPEYFKRILYNLGMDTTYPILRQDGLMHRNRFNEVALCSRYVGNERQDEEWITSGYASVEAKDKYSGSRLLEDMYRVRNLTEDTQWYLEKRDYYRPIDETYD